MKNAAQKSKLSHLQLTSTIPESWLPFKTTLELPVYQGMFGQERAMNAIDIGLKIDARGFNIFAVGESGSGKTSTIERILKDRAASEPIPDDLLYVTCFKNPSQPRPIFVPPGSGRKLASDISVALFHPSPAESGHSTGPYQGIFRRRHRHWRGSRYRPCDRHRQRPPNRR